MRTLLATLLLVPALALAQSNLEPPTTGTRIPPRPPRGQKVRGLPRPAPGAPRGDPAENPAVALPPTPTAGGPGVRHIPTAPPPAPVAPAAPGAGGEATITPAEGRCVPLQGRFMLAFNKAEIVDVLEQASRWTCRNFIYTEDIARGKITLLSKTAVTAEEAYAAFLAALSANNIVLYPTGKYYKLGRAPDSKKLPIPTYTDPETGVPATEQVVTKVIRLQSTDADMLRGVLGNFISPQGADIQSIPPDTLIITDIAINIRRIEKILESVDRSGSADVIRVIQIRYAAARDIADKLNQIFQAQGQGRKGIAAARPQGRPGAPPPPGAVQQPGQQSADIITVSKVLADDRTNKLIVIADDKSFQRVQELLEQLDVPTGADGGIHVVFLKNASAEELSTTLSNLAQGQSKRSAGGQGAPPGVPMVRGVPGVPGAPAAPESTTAELFSGEVKVTADKTQNALLIQASGADFAAISRLVEKLDRPRRQVFVEAVIMEVNISNQTNFGVAAHAFVDVEVNGKKGAIPLISAPNPGKLSSLDLKSIAGLGGFLTGFSGPTSGVLEELTGLKLPSLGVLMQALQSNDDVNVLSTPNVLATDNEEAEIAVGENRPFQTGYFPSGLSNLLGSSSSTTSSALTSGLGNLAAGIQRQNVELRLKMKPQINEGGAVRLTVEVQNETVAAENETLGPTTAKRSVKTQIVAKDQSTIVIGGLIQDSSSRSVSKVPVLGSLPVLGGLFRSSQTVKKRTNLLVFLTPYIIRNEGDYRRIYEKKRREQEEFLSQFYGKKSGITVDVDYSRKSSPLSRIHQGVTEETSRIQNGGPGLPGEGVTTPPLPPGDVPERRRASEPAAPAPEPLPVAPLPPSSDAPPEATPPTPPQE